MKTLSSKIDHAILIAERKGNKVAEITTGWTKVKQVVQMESPASEEILSEIAKIPFLRNWETLPTPHNKGEHGFTDDDEKVAITFPINR
jgi:hypothetical protein